MVALPTVDQMSFQTVLGANVADLEAFARAVQQADHQVGSLVMRVQQQRNQIGVNAIDCWDGPDARELRRYMDVNVLPVARKSQVTLAGLAHTIRRQAESQRIASSASPRWTVDYYSPHGDGRWVARYGSVTDNSMIILVPGVGTDLHNIDRLSETAKDLWGHLDPVGDISVMVWLGYDPPDSVIAGIDSGPAQAGAEALQDDISALRRDGIDNIYVVGHSYGAVVSALALSSSETSETKPDAVVLLGSPGTGGGPLPPDLDTRVYAARSDWDFIELASRLPFIHGHDPLIGAKVLPTSLTGHSDYLRDPSIVNSLVKLISLHENQHET